MNNKTIYGVFINNGCGGFLEDYIVVCHRRHNVYNHFLNRFKKYNNFYGNMELINRGWNLSSKKCNYITEPCLEDVILNHKDWKFDIESPEHSTDIEFTTTDTFIFELLLWYCKKFKIKQKNIKVNDIKKLFEKYAQSYEDGIFINRINNAFILI